LLGTRQTTVILAREEAVKDRRVVLRRLEVSRGGTLDQVQRTAGDVVDTAGSAPIPAGLNPEGFFADELRALPLPGAAVD